MYFVPFIILLFSHLGWSQHEFDDVCKPKICTNSNMTSKYVIEYCNENQTIYNRCCLKTDNMTSFITGIDYSECSLSSLDLQANLTDSIRLNISILDLRGVNIIKCNNEIYAGFVNLEALYLPDECECPGRNYSWTNYENKTCLKQINICNTTYPNVKCTDNSKCDVFGPGNFLCNCKENFHGYKCLNEGKFPTLVFTACLCGGTLFLSALLWHFQRRHAKFD